MGTIKKTNPIKQTIKETKQIKQTIKKTNQIKQTIKKTNQIKQAIKKTYYNKQIIPDNESRINIPKLSQLDNLKKVEPFKVGNKIKIIGLKKNLNYNGKVGRIIECPNSVRSNYTILIDELGEFLRI